MKIFQKIAFTVLLLASLAANAYNFRENGKLKADNEAQNMTIARIEREYKAADTKMVELEKQVNEAQDKEIRRIDREYKAADIKIAARIDSEATARANADKALAANMKQGFNHVYGSINETNKHINATENRIDAAVGNLQTLTNDNILTITKVADRLSTDESNVSEEFSDIQAKIDAIISQIAPLTFTPPAATDAVEEVAPAVEEATPAAVEEVAPIVVEEPTTVVVEEATPAAVDEVAPIVVEPAAPVVEEVAPAVVEPAAPVVEEVAPAVVEPAAPVVEEVAPAAVEPAAPAVVEPAAPEIDKEKAARDEIDASFNEQEQSATATDSEIDNGNANLGLDENGFAPADQNQNNATVVVDFNNASKTQSIDSFLRVLSFARTR